MGHFCWHSQFLFYSVNSELQDWHLPFSTPVAPIIKILPIVPHFGHSPVVTFLGELGFAFTVFLRTINTQFKNRIIKSKRLDFQKARGVGFEPTGPCGHGISNPTPYQARRPPHTGAENYNC